MTVQFGLLGEVTAYVDGSPVDLGPVKQRCVLAALAVDGGRVVPRDRLADRVWGPDASPRTRRALYSYISRLRLALGGSGRASIERRAGGYLLGDPDLVDLHRFRALCAGARASRDPAHTVRTLTDAVGLWRGEALSGLGGEWAAAERSRLGRERRAAEDDLVDARLALGHGEDLVAELAARAEDNPLDERVAGQYLLVLYRAGRAADALDHYRRLRARLVGELGTDPGEPLRELHHRILSGDPALVAAERLPEQPTGPVPRQLPPAPAGFTGRAAEQAELTTALGGADGDIVPVTVVTGTGGIGKTWLALHWAHRHADRFPDGHLFVDLQGFSPAASPMDPSTALRGFLGALGVDPRAVPPDLHAQSALFRSLLAGRRVLVVVDNARSSDQVAPLLPGSPTCAVVVTSRDRLAELPARHGARPVRLDVLTADEARSVFTDRVGVARIDAEPEAGRELLSWCGGYPLALAIVAGRATAYPEFPLSALAGELRDEATRLDALDDDNAGMSLPTVLSWSHRALSAQQARTFALLGLAPGSDVGLPAAANLLDLPVPTTRQVLRTLEDLHLVVQHAPARWSMHDLVKLYAAGVAEQDPGGTERNAALRRLVDFYLHSAYSADRLLEPHRSPIHLDPPAPGCHPHRTADGSSALGWFSAEHPNLLAAQRLAAERGHDTQAWQLAWALDDFHHRGGHLHDAVSVWRVGLRAVERTGDRAALVLAHRLLGGTATYTGLHEEAMTHLTRSLELAEEAGDRLARAHAHRVLAQAWEQHGDDGPALRNASAALALYEELELAVWVGNQLNAVGWYLARTGAYESARAHCTAALGLALRHGDDGDEADALDSLGFIAHHSGRPTDAVDYYQRALELQRRRLDSFEEADTLDRLAHAHVALGEAHRAREAWRQAVELYRVQHRTRDVERVLRGLDDLAPDR